MVEIKKITTPYGTEFLCAKCGCEVEWQECYDCEEGLSHHDCGEDCCNCLDPEPNVVCDVCNGEGGWWVCHNCNKNITQGMTKRRNEPQHQIETKRTG